MELDGCREEGLRNLLVEVKGRRNHGRSQLLDGVGAACASQVLAEDTGVDGGEGVLAWEAEGKHTEVPLQREMNKQFRVMTYPSQVSVCSYQCKNVLFL